jgi:hypothetical protein
VVAKVVVIQAAQTVLAVALAVVDDGTVAPVGLERQIKAMRVETVMQTLAPLLRLVVVVAQVLLVKPVNQLLAVLAVMVLHLLSQAHLKLELEAVVVDTLMVLEAAPLVELGVAVLVARLALV